MLQKKRNTSFLKRKLMILSGRNLLYDMYLYQEFAYPGTYMFKIKFSLIFKLFKISFNVLKYFKKKIIATDIPKHTLTRNDNYNTPIY